MPELQNKTLDFQIKSNVIVPAGKHHIQIKLNEVKKAVYLWYFLFMVGGISSDFRKMGD